MCCTFSLFSCAAAVGELKEKAEPCAQPAFLQLPPSALVWWIMEPGSDSVLPVPACDITPSFGLPE